MTGACEGAIPIIYHGIFPLEYLDAALLPLSPPSAPRPARGGVRSGLGEMEQSQAQAPSPGRPHQQLQIDRAQYR